MNDISTSPLIFNAEYDPLLCLFRGNKRTVLVDTNKYPDVRQVSSKSPPSLLVHDRFFSLVRHSLETTITRTTNQS